MPAATCWIFVGSNLTIFKLKNMVAKHAQHVATNNVAILKIEYM